MSLIDKIDYSIALMRKAEKLALEYDPVDGFYLAFSGGKDSQTIYHLAQMAGVRFKAWMNFTSADPGEVIRFVKHQYPDVERIPPKISIYNLAKKKKILPTRFARWCCAEYKETSGKGKVTILGVRHEESIKRRSRKELEMIHGRKTKFADNFDQFSEHKETMVTCVDGKDKVLLSPILDWTEKDVWTFLNEVVKVPHCEVYDKGYSRVGCVLCPMASSRMKRKFAEDYPYAKKKWIETIDYLQNNIWWKKKGEILDLTAEEYFDYWISGKSQLQWLAENKYQRKLFEEEFNKNSNG